jgi:putative transposase
MSNIRRYYIPNSTIFITSVTYRRGKFLSEQMDLDLFWVCTKQAMERYPFKILAFVILPDHFHWLMRMPETHPNFSEPLYYLKGKFSYQYKRAHHIKGPIQVWQPRFWDHIIRNEEDLRVHLNYIYWNPVKHGYVDDVGSWTQISIGTWSPNFGDPSIKQYERFDFE